MTTRELISALEKLPQEALDYQACYYDLEDGSLTITKIQIIEPQGTDPRFQHEPYVQLL